MKSSLSREEFEKWFESVGNERSWLSKYELWLAWQASCGEALRWIPEKLAERFHETYERLAPQFYYETRKQSSVPWALVPEKNKRLMIAVCAEILAAPYSRPSHVHDLENPFCATNPDLAKYKPNTRLCDPDEPQIKLRKISDSRPSTEEK